MNQQLNRVLTIQLVVLPCQTSEHTAPLLRVRSSSRSSRPPEAVTIDEITDTTAQLSWRPGPDNHSPVTCHHSSQDSILRGLQPSGQHRCCIEPLILVSHRGFRNSAEWTQLCGFGGLLFLVQTHRYRWDFRAAFPQASAHYTYHFIFSFYWFICLFFNLF